MSSLTIVIHQGSAAAAWVHTLHRRTETGEIAQRVHTIIEQVRRDGDLALGQLAQKFQDPEPRVITAAELQAHEPEPEVKALLERAAANISRFAQAVAASVQPVKVESEHTVAGMRMQPVERVACYAPGGRHPLPSTVLMAGLSARAAGVPQVSLICPSPHPAVLYAARLIKAERVYLMGGAQAVAAAAFGTQTVEKVDMVVGPGNAYVTEAKRQLQGVIGIDMLAGPSEVTVLADDGADPRWVALDLLAQAEHDPMACVVLVTTSLRLAQAVAEHISRLASEVTLPDFIQESLHNSALLVFDSDEECLEAVERLAPEHLQLAVAEPETVAPRLHHYGGLFMGYQATVPFGDYMAGPNHTLPTSGTARFSSGLSPLTFLRPQCWMTTTGDFQALARDTAAFADLEGLHAHAAAARARLKD